MNLRSLVSLRHIVAKFTNFPNILKFFILGNILHLSCLFGFRKTLVESTREKRDCLSSLLEQKHISLFYCNSRKAILNPHQHRSKTEFCQELFARPAFSRKSGQFCVAIIQQPKKRPRRVFFYLYINRLIEFFGVRSKSSSSISMS